VLLERDTELVLLDRTVLEVESGTGALLLISGRPGSGRSALVRELSSLAAARGAEVLRAHGALSERDFRFGVLRQLLEPLLAEPEESARPLESLLTEGEDDGGAGPPEAVLHRLHALLVSRGAGRTVVLLVDDLRWADEASVRCLAYLITRLGGMRVLICAVLSEDDVRTPLAREILASATQRLRTRPLSPEATRKMVTAQFGSAHDVEFAECCHELTDGNPRELRSLLAKAAANRVEPYAGGIPELRLLGESDRRDRFAVLLGRDPAAAGYAQAVVVLGERATPALADRVAALDPADLTRAKRMLSARWMSVEPNRVRVVDPDLVAVVEESMSAEESTRLHERAARVLHGYGYDPELVADQLMPVNAPLGKWAIDQLRVASDAARLRAAPDTAARYLRRALRDLAPDGTPRARLLAELAAVELGFDPASAVRHIVQSVPRLDTVRDRADVLSRIPLTVPPSSRVVGELIRDVARQLGDPESVEDRDLALRLEARIRFAGIEDPGEQDAAITRLDELAGAPSPHSAADRELRMVLLRAAVLTGKAPAADVARMATEILAAEPANSTRVHSVAQFLPMTMVVADSVEGLGSWLGIALEHARRQHAAGTGSVLEADRAVLCLHTGKLAEARESALRAVERAGAGPLGSGSITIPAIALGAVARRLRDEELAERVLDLQPDPPDMQVFAMQRLLKGALAEWRGELLAALAQYLDCGRRLERAGWLNPAISPWRAAAAQVRARLGDTMGAVELAEEDYSRAVAWGAPTAVGRALRVRAAVTGGDGGVEFLREAVRVLRDSPSELEFGQAMVELGRRIEETDPREAGVVLREGHRLVGRFGAGRLADGAEDAAGIPGQRGARSDLPGLTRSEDAVARLAARGRTNQEIADELGVSRRAVEKHLTSSYRKLMIEGRADLAGALSGYLSAS
jgi:DNA-binding CsgD family transcriptional regulator